MNQQQALQILINSAEIACTKGVFNLKEAKLVADAVDMFTKQPTDASKNVQEPQDEEKTNESKKD